jgi:hypothetical protein
MPAQFIVIPPLAKVSSYFREATGRPVTPSVTWSTWNKLSHESYTEIASYIRPCHSNILDSTRDGLYDTPCALMRQLLRPHGMRIDYRNNVWTLREIEEGHEKGIRTRSGCLIVWD